MRNEMMHRPVLKDEVLDLVRNRQNKVSGTLGEIQAQATIDNVPIIPNETASFLRFFLKQIKAKNVLEVGTAIGFSASLMLDAMGEGSHVTTIDRFDVMIKKAKANFEKLGVQEQVTLLEGDAKEVLPTLEGPYDFIFMDSAKSKYIEFLPECLRLLKVDGVLMIDDVFQAGTIMHDIKEIPRSQRTIYRKLNELYDVVLNHEDLTVTILPLGDGVLMISKDVETIII
ncbi:O-methyltransferase [Vagococcus fluvialis]|jgi:predicted O-methyltransferase YrrM|uniref:O-methyltransferase n=1 Tax=Vagococcus fluvialis TaxID=2738 RepID=UPI001A8FC7F7|nr:O-methyltransferase [Vagococcus fluvialis]MDR2276248.1 O-methyltransferase [Vagococcus sp.]MBO0442455.1 O-methyltransferase [Vagococcus fluvialis]MBO0487715.1 O-methyltransferase [Vagococcus fluvialis]MCM2138151.1 O-methyltransferase [Vagococcus fluvialis]MDT2746851.1 O-methyltransferase [Vagococcus fluvialis]